MELNEYIRRNYKTPNPFILKDLGACDELIAYLRYTPENTNFNVADPYCGGGTDGDSYTIRFEVNSKVGDFAPSVLLKCDDDVSELVSLPYEIKVAKGESFTPLGVVIEECEGDCAYFKPASNEYEYSCPTMVADRDMTFIWTRQDLED